MHARAVSRIVDLLYSVTTGPAHRRRLLTPVGLAIALTLMALVVLASFLTDDILELPAPLPGALGVSIGAVLLAGGLALWGWSIILFKGKGVPFNPPRELVLVGPYAWVRNPMLLGILAAFVGLGLLLHSFSMVFIWTPAFIILNLVEIKFIEEPELERRLGDPYRQYIERVPMLIPKRPDRRIDFKNR